MTLFLILAPYGAFAALMLLTSSAVSLFASAAICLAVIGLDLWRGRAIKILGAGSVVTFVTVGLYVSLIDPSTSAAMVHLAVDAGILLVTLFSLAIRQPFTLQYALEVTDTETAKFPGFLSANYVITWAWAGASLLIMLGNAATIYIPWLPFWASLLIAFAARNTAIYFTKWYPDYRKTKSLAKSVAALMPANAEHA